jgi:predicted RNase H-like HicB family nuclease
MPKAAPIDIRYEVILYWSDADAAFIAEVPELPGCAADGSTYREALANVELVIREWIDTARELGRPIPAPRGRLMFA